MANATSHAHHDASVYYVPHGSHWPIVGSVGLFSTVFGAANWMNGNGWGEFVMYGGIGVLLVMLFGWFGSGDQGKRSRASTTSRRWTPRSAWG
jgi:hypothetical protein